MLTGNESIEEYFQVLYDAQMRLLRQECERLFAPLADIIKDEDFTDDIIIAA